MYKFHTILLLFTSLILFSQENNNDTTFFKIGGSKIIIIGSDSIKNNNPDFRGHFVGFSIGLNLLNTSPSSNYTSGNINEQVLELNEIRSWEVNFDFFQHSFNLYKEHFGLVTGLGLKFNNYRFKNYYRIINTSDSIYAVEDTINNFYKTKLSITKLRIPLIFEWQNKIGRKHRLIFVSAGVFGSYNIVSYMKYNYKRDGNKIKEKIYETYQLNPFQYGVAFKFAYGIFEIYAEYNISKMFITDKAISVNQFSVGLVLVDF
jgi:hypothetical protein